MRNKFLLLAILFFCALSTFAQVQSEQGSLVLKDGRVLEGKISYYYDNPLVLNIYDAASNKQTFEPGEIQEFTLANGERFVSRGYSSGGIAQQLIFQVVVAADKISLYKRDAADLEYYAEKDNTVYKLENNETTVNGENGKRYNKQDYKYVGTLTTLMHDRSDLIEKIQKTELTEKSLASIVTAYNNGAVTYYFASEVKVDKKPIWAAYAHYSNHGSYLGDETTGPSMGFQVGAQYYFSTAGRNSVRIGLDFSRYEFQRTVREMYHDHQETWYHDHQMLTLKYQYDFVQQEKTKLYLLVNIIEIGHYAQTPEDTDYEESSGITLVPRLSPGAGFEYKPKPNMAAFVEVNNILHFKTLPSSFSVGARYYFLK